MSCCALHRVLNTRDYNLSTSTASGPSQRTQGKLKLAKSLADGPQKHKEIRTLITNATIYTANPAAPYIENGWLAFEGDTIIAVGENTVQPPYCDNVIDRSGFLVLPGFVNPHWHESFAAPNFESPTDQDLTPTAYSQGGDIAALGGLFGFISNVGNLLTKEEATAIARWSLWTQLRSGTTTLGDLGSANTADAMAQAAIDLGMRLFVSRWCSDIMIPAEGNKAIEVADCDGQIADVEHLMKTWHNHSSGLINGMPTVMGTFGSSDKQLRAIKAIADDYSATYAMHLGALRNEDDAVKRVFKRSSISRVAHLGLLSNRLMTVHTAYGSDQEFSGLLEAGVHICQAPGHYGQLGEKTLSETGRFSKLLQENYPLATSTDGDINYTGGMTEAMRAAHLGLNEVANCNTCCPPTKALMTGTAFGASALNLNQCGQIISGKQADLVLIDANNWRYKNSRHWLRTHLLTGSSNDIHSVYIAGKAVVDNYQSTRFNENELWQDYLTAAESARARIRP